MKKLILFAAILFVGVSVAKAQDVSKLTTDEAKLTLKFNRFQQITVDSHQKANVLLEYKDVDDYKTGVNLDQGDHLTVNSTGAFTVSVGADDLISEDVKAKTIAASTILITPTKGSKNADNSQFTANTIGTKEKPSTIITSSRGGMEKKYSVNYKAQGDYMDNHINGEGVMEYTTTVYYTIVAN